MIKEYAKVLGGVVGNVLLADSGEEFDANFTFVDITGLSPKPGPGWTYDGNAFAPPVAPVPVLAVAKAKKLQTFTNEINAFVESRYPIQVRMNLIGIYLNAQRNNLTNRMAYIAPLLDWQDAVLLYTSSFILSVQAQVDAATTVALMWDFTALAASDPAITAVGALAILD